MSVSTKNSFDRFCLIQWMAEKKYSKRTLNTNKDINWLIRIYTFLSVWLLCDWINFFSSEWTIHIWSTVILICIVWKLQNPHFRFRCQNANSYFVQLLEHLIKVVVRSFFSRFLLWDQLYGFTIIIISCLSIVIDKSVHMRHAASTVFYCWGDPVCANDSYCTKLPSRWKQRTTSVMTITTRFWFAYQAHTTFWFNSKHALKALSSSTYAINA